MALSDQDPELEKRKAQAFERILAEALSSAARNPDCPDAETLAAFYDRALDAAETARLRAHFAACARCQQVLAAMAVSDPNPLVADEVARLGELVAAASAPRAASREPRILSWPRYLDPRTLAPLAAAAILVIAFWSTTHSPSITPGEYATEAPAAPSISEPLVAENQPAPPPSSAEEEPATQAPAPKTNTQTAPLSTAMSPPPPAPAPSAEAPAAESAQNQTAREESANDKTARDESKMRAPNPAPAGASAATSESPAVTAQAATPPPPAPEASGGAANGGAPAAADRAEGGTAGDFEAGNVDHLSRGIGSSAAMVRAKTSTPADSAAAKTNPQFIWRFGRAGRIERSSDGGTTWTPQSSPVESDLLAGSAPSETVCWLVGRNGTIIRTTDGVNWQPVPSPPEAEQNGQPPDWTLVEAHDALSAVIRTENGRRFSTSDGGKTWQPQ
jgi:outer membrane biosynthesis protein TonB